MSATPPPDATAYERCAKMLDEYAAENGLLTCDDVSRRKRR